MGSTQLTYIEDARLEWNPQDKGPDSLLGEGAFGSVYRGTLDLAEVAIKVIKRSNNGPLQSEQAKQAQEAASQQHARELRRLKRLRHTCIVQFLGAACDPVSSETLIVTELLSGGSLHDALQVMRNYGTGTEGGAVLEERSFLRIGGCIASGLVYLHNEKYTHGDMKPHNVLLNSTVEILDAGTRAVFQKDVQAKIADFGLSRSIGPKADDLMATTNTQDFGAGPVGTFAYMAPQAFDGIAKMSGDIAKAADIYAFAIVMYELLCGRQPWVAENVRSVWTLCRYVCSEERRPSWGPREQSIRPEYIAFVERCWAQKWEERPSSVEVARQFNAWNKAFKARVAGTSVDGTDISVGSSESGSPSVLPNEREEAAGGAENQGESESKQATKAAADALNRGDSDNLDVFGDLGNTENGTPILQRVVTENLDAKQAMDAVKHHAKRDPYDFGDSTDTRIDDSTDTRLEDSNGQVPPNPEDEISEYDAVGNAIRDESVGPASPRIEYAGQSSLDLLDSGAFDNFVKRVETERVPLPDIEQLQIGLPLSVKNEKQSGGIEDFAVGQQNADKFSGFSGFFDREKKDMQDGVADSFMRAAAQYGNDDVSAATEKPTVADSGNEAAPNADVASASGGAPKLDIAPALDIPSLKIDLPGNPKGQEKKPVDWEHSPVDRPSFDASEVSNTVNSGESKDDNAAISVPVVPEGVGFFPPPSRLSPPQHPTYSTPTVMYPSNGPTFPGYGPAPGAMTSSVMSAAALWDHRASAGNHRTANPIPHNGTSPPQMIMNPGPRAMFHSFSVTAALDAIRSRDALQTLDRFWNAGYAGVIASAFAQGATSTPASLSGKAHLNLALEFIKRNNQTPKEPIIARDLCVAVGSFAMNQSNTIGRATAMDALPVALSAMQSNHNEVVVYSSCCFAMSNLLKISNHIEDPNLRKDVAVWIVHAISWNLSRGTKLDSLAYTACSAARNFMWLNELNTATFLSKNDVLFNAPPLRKLLSSMLYFRVKEKVLEASLSALAMIAFFPVTRQELIMSDIALVLVEMLRENLPRSNVACLCLSILSVLVSEPGPANDEERNLWRKSLPASNACATVLQAIHFSTDQQKQQRNLGAVQVLEEALATLVALCDFDEEMRSVMVENSAVLVVTEALRGFAVVNVPLIHSTLLTNCAIQMCEATYSLAKSGPGLKSLKDSEATRFLKNIKTLFRDDERLVVSATKAITALSE